jgi:hypothetical protein
MTFLLCLTVYETAVNKDASCGKNACIAIGWGTPSALSLPRRSFYTALHSLSTDACIAVIDACSNKQYNSITI